MDGLLALLAAHAVRYPEDGGRVAQVRALVETHPDCLARTCLPGHLTASAWILSPDRRRVLLALHRKLGRWLQPGGHADGDADPRRVALREAREETGLARLTVVGRGPLDVDLHAIPATTDEPAHVHHDVRFLVVAAPGDLRISEESRALRWFDRDRLAGAAPDEGMLRMERRARALLG